MSLFSAVSSFFSVGKTTDNIFDKDNGLLTQAGGWINNLQHTSQEIAADNKEMIKAGNEFVKATLDENTIRSRTRRMVAVGWIKTQIAMILITMIVAPFDMELAKFYAGIAFGWLMTTGTLAVIGFFFGTHMLRARLNIPQKNSVPN